MGNQQYSFGFRLIGYKGVIEFYSEQIFAQDEWVEHLRKVCISFNISYRYSFEKLLGKGSFARVHRAIKKRDSREYAIKTLEKTKMLEHPRRLQALQNEILILRMLNHKNIIKLYEVYENDLYIHMVLEYIKGGELFKQLQSKGAYSEKDAVLMFKLILEALAYCHERNVVHRDLKPENMILLGGENKWELKIADFGLATIMDPKVPQMLRCGSPGYVAPEVLNSLGYGTKADIYSAGVILIVLLTGKLPFSGRNYHEVMIKNKEEDVAFDEHCWKHLSAEAKDLAGKLTVRNPEKRLSAKEALAHPWFQKEHAGTPVLLTAMENMKKYNDRNRFNMEKIKPEFSMVTCTPLMSSRGDSAHSSPIGIQPRFVAPSPQIQYRRLVKPEEAKVETTAGPVIFRNIKTKKSTEKAKLSTFYKEDLGNENFKEEDIDEQCSTARTNATESSSKQAPLISPRKVPLTPGFNKRTLPQNTPEKLPLTFRRLDQNIDNMEKSDYIKKLVQISKHLRGPEGGIGAVLSPIKEIDTKKPLEESKQRNLLTTVNAGDTDDDNEFVSALCEAPERINSKKSIIEKNSDKNVGRGKFR